MNTRPQAYNTFQSQSFLSEIWAQRGQGVRRGEGPQRLDAGKDEPLPQRVLRKEVN